MIKDDKGLFVAEAATDRFWRKVDKTDNCWLWTGGLTLGYGLFWTGKRNIRAHRFAYREAKGNLVDTDTLDHLCRNKACVNPSHLEIVTQQQNVKRGKQILTHCKNGHRWSSANTYIRKDNGHRVCRTCASNWGKASYLRKKLEIDRNDTSGGGVKDEAV